MLKRCSWCVQVDQSLLHADRKYPLGSLRPSQPCQRVGTVSSPLCCSAVLRGPGTTARAWVLCRPGGTAGLLLHGGRAGRADLERSPSSIDRARAPNPALPAGEVGLSPRPERRASEHLRPEARAGAVGATAQACICCIRSGITSKARLHHLIGPRTHLV